jgi:bacterioferritin-associated ferredoxin
MIVCHCNVFSDHDVRACLRSDRGGPRTPAQVYACLGCSPQCGRCARTIRSVIDTALAAASCAAGCAAPCPHARASAPAGAPGSHAPAREAVGSGRAQARGAQGFASAGGA